MLVNQCELCEHMYIFVHAFVSMINMFCVSGLTVLLNEGNDLRNYERHNEMKDGHKPCHLVYVGCCMLFMELTDLYSENM